MDQEDQQLLDPEVDALQLEVQAADVPQQVQEVVVHQLEAQVVEVLQQVDREVDVLQLEVQAVDVLQQVQEVVVHQLEAQAVEGLQQGVREADVPQAAVGFLQRVGLGVTCASVWMRKC